MRRGESKRGSGSHSAAKRRRPWRRRLGIGCLSVFALFAVAAGALWLIKPWAPKIVVVDPGSGGTRVTDQGLLANYYPAKDRAPGILVLGGSEGGLSASADAEGRELRDAGYSTLVVSYFGGPKQPKAMDALPLETFDTALEYLKSQPQVDPSRLGIVGTSKGGEAALLVASRHPELKATVGLVPSNVVWQGLDQQQPWRMASIGSTWSEDGNDVPFLPYGEFTGGDTVELYRAGLAQLDAHPDAVIPIEKAGGSVLLVCGGADTLWPSCDMSRQVEKRSNARGGPSVTLLEYPDAGHFAAGPPLPQGNEFYSSLGMFGGTPETNQAARADVWPQVLAHLERSLGNGTN